MYRWLDEVTAEELMLWFAYLELEAAGKLDYLPADQLAQQMKTMWGTRANPN